MDNNKVQINVRALYEAIGECTKYHAINHGYEDGEEFFDILDEFGNLACMNGEMATITADIGDDVALMNDESGVERTFKLTKNELEIAQKV